MSSGVRCADTTFASKLTPNRSSTSAAFFMTSQSEDEPMTSPTTGPIPLAPFCMFAILSKRKVHLRGK